MSGPAPPHPPVVAPTTPSRPIPRITTTTPSQSTQSTNGRANTNSHGHARRGSYASPIDIKPKSPAARRMSMTATRQSDSLTPESALDRLGGTVGSLQGVVGGVVASLMLSGIMYSLFHSTSLDTSNIHHIHHAPRLAYFARKSNLFNTIFVKRAWGWTTLAYLFHLFTSPPSQIRSRSRGSSKTYARRRRMGIWFLATLAWLLFTRWFFGAGVGDRIIALTGGNCALPLPKEIDYERARQTFPTLFTSSSTSTSALSGSGLQESTEPESNGARLYLPLPSEYCSGPGAGKVDSTTFPELFALFPSSSSSDEHERAGVAGADVSEIDLSRATADHPPLLALPRPRWHKGFDISGHAFLLTLSIMVLARELAPTWRAWARSFNPNLSSATPTGTGKVTATGTISILHAFSTVFATALVGVWGWMILMTAVYFHNPPEKLSGLLLGLATSALINLLVPDLDSEVTSTLANNAPSAKSTARSIPFKPTRLFDENAARRGEIVDDGRIVEVDEDEDGAAAVGVGVNGIAIGIEQVLDGEVDGKGRLKGKVE